MAELRTDYVDDVLDTSKNTIRKYKQIQNSDGTVSFVDVTEYLTVGTEFGAKDINDITKANNDLNDSLSDKKIATLWEHPNFRDTSNLPIFAPQTLSIANLGNYDIIGICNSCYDRTRSRFNFVPNIPNKEQNLDSVWSSDSNGYEFCAYYRKFTISNDGITFDAGYSVRSGIRAKSNDYAIPIKIIGIKLI